MKPKNPLNIEKVLQRMASATPRDKEWCDRFRPLLLAHMQQNPIRPASSISALVPFWTGRRDRIAPQSLRTLQKPMPIIISLMFILVAASGTSIAAEHSLPGDILFPIKIGVNEQIAGALRVSSEDQANFSVSLVQKRMHEIAQLAASSELSSENEAQINARLHKNIHAAQNAIENAREENTQAAAEASVALESTLRVWSEFLDRFTEDEGGRKGLSIAIENIQARLTPESEASVQTTSDIELEERENASATGLEMSAKGKVGAAENKLEAVERHIKRAEERHNDNAQAARAKFTASMSILDAARTALEEKKWTDAFSKAQQAMRLGTEAQVLANAGVTLHVQENDVHEEEPKGNEEREETAQTHTQTSVNLESNGTNADASNSLDVGPRLHSLFR